MGKKHTFSLYDIEQFLKDAGAERVNERAVISFEQELENTLNDLLNEAERYANYAGRRNLIKRGDIKLLSRNGSGHVRYPKAHHRWPVSLSAKAKITNANSMPHM